MNSAASTEPGLLAAWQTGEPSPAPVLSTPGRVVGLASLLNLRDLGGLPAAEGTIRSRVVYRSAAPDRISPADAQAVADLGVALIADLRTAAERAAAPSRWSLTQRVFDVLGDTQQTDAAQIMAFLGDPGAAARYLAGGVGRGHLLNTYRDLVDLPSARAAYRELFLLLADPATPPLLLHCTTGKDRTGWAVAAALLLCGVSQEEVTADYLLSNDLLLPAFGPIFARVEQEGADSSGLRAVLGVDADYLVTALETMTAGFGDIGGYFRDGLGISEEVQARLRARLVRSDTE
ncbi:MAG: tyrosine-protein phosphatase [Candidatus Nanopelagicales bacterium]